MVLLAFGRVLWSCPGAVLGRLRVACHLLTGATGLLGNYLLKGALTAGLDVAVLARPSRLATEKERVEDIMLRWERLLERDLPRPPVFAADLAEPDLALDVPTRKWIAENCSTFIHNAASLTFEANEKTGEPRRTNIDGTRNVLALCEELGIRRMHYVSTAYICGLRQGRVLESEVDVGQTPGNAYEETKLEAEKMVRAADFLDSLTVYRPAIIIGDSQTGYTTTFHGFYTPLRIVHGVSHKLPLGYGARPLPESLGLVGNEFKNFVPVDWVASIICHVMSNQKFHGTTYHLTPQNAVDVQTMYDQISEAVVQFSPPRSDSESGLLDFKELTEIFLDQMTAYRSYWRDDPVFDTTNLLKVAPHLPCPRVDKEMLKCACHYAIENNFGWPAAPPQKADFDVGAAISQVVVNRDAGEHTQRIGLHVFGQGGAQCTLSMDGGSILGMEPGICDPDGHAYLNSRIFRQLWSGELNFDDAWQSGQVALQRCKLPRVQLLPNVRAALTAALGDVVSN